jgi:hypothetical protein
MRSKMNNALSNLEHTRARLKLQDEDTLDELNKIAWFITAEFKDDLFRIDFGSTTSSIAIKLLEELLLYRDIFGALHLDKPKRK